MTIVRHEPGVLPLKPQVEQRAISTKLPFLAELEAACRHVRGGPSPKSSAAEGLRIVETIAGLRQLAGLDVPAFV
ncbi:MAG: hypothetical protein U0514_00480 [Candidatus Andersenbacteria bacterium]